MAAPNDIAFKGTRVNTTNDVIFPVDKRAGRGEGSTAPQLLLVGGGKKEKT